MRKIEIIYAIIEKAIEYNLVDNVIEYCKSREIEMAKSDDRELDDIELDQKYTTSGPDKKDTTSKPDKKELDEKNTTSESDSSEYEDSDNEIDIRANRYNEINSFRELSSIFRSHINRSSNPHSHLTDLNQMILERLLFNSSLANSITDPMTDPLSNHLSNPLSNPIVNARLTISPSLCSDNSDTIFQKSDNVTVPARIYQQLLNSSRTLYILKVIYNDSYVLCRPIAANNSTHHIVMPDWLITKLGAQGNSVIVQSCDLEIVKSVVFQVPKIMKNPDAILEYELQKHTVLFEGKLINVKMFDLTYQIRVKTVRTITGLTEGTIGNTDVEFTMEFV